MPGRRPEPRLLGLLLIAALAATGAAPPASSPFQGLIAPGKAPGMLLLYTGDVIGYVNDCGCPKNPAGGLGRRAWALEKIHSAFPEAPRILLDSGNFSDNPTAAGDLRTRSLLDAMGRLGYGGANVAERDLLMGYEDFVKKTEGVKFPFLSTNVVRQDTKEPVFKPYLVLEAKRADKKPAIRVGVLGVVRYNPLFLKSGPEKSNLVIASPRSMLQRFVPEVRKKADIVVLLAAIQQDDARMLAREVPGIDFIFGAYGGYTSSPDSMEGTTRILYTGNQGKQLGETRVYLEGAKLGSSDSFIHTLDARYGDDAAMAQFQKDVTARVSALSEAGTAKAEEAGQDGERRPFAGATACKSCHEAEHTSWLSTSHAKAFGTLVDAKADENLACKTCHVTGAGEEGGFRSASASPDLAGVTCESCHGPGAAHVERPAKGYGKIEVTSCIGCHNRENSPKFDYATYLAKVTHR